jgi:hypothetical protein
MLISILLGSSIKNIIVSLKNDTGIKYQENEYQIIFDIDKNLFAAPIKSKIDLFYNVTDRSYINISPLFEEIILLAQQYINQNEVDVLYAEINNFLQESKKKYNKTIVLNLNHLGLIMHQYFKRFNKHSNISLLYIKEISKSEQAKLCYCTSNDRLYNLENWIIKLSNILDLPNVFKKINKINTSIQYDKKIGSHYYLKPGVFKNFLLNLFKLHNLVDTKIEKFNIKMIYLRYSLGLLLATRDFNNSCNLSQYSQRFKILLLQEKAKSIYTAKRIIPLCDYALKEIKRFYKLKLEYKLISYHPVFIDIKNDTKNEILITKTSAVETIKKMKNNYNDDLIEQITNFIKYVKLNFGRHIITSYMAHSNNIKGDYIDAFLNHYTMGTEDQGMFNNFNNRDYINTITQIMQEIATKYYPKSIDFFND